MDIDLVKNVSKNLLWVQIGKRRWLKKILSPLLPSIVEFPLDSDLSIFLDLKDVRGPSFYLMYGGPKAFDHYEYEDKKEILNYLPKNGVFIDAGANIGLFSYFVHRHLPTVKIIAIEPHPLLYQCLELTKKRNSLHSLQTYLCGLSDRVGQMDLYVDLTDSGGHSLDRNSLHHHKESIPPIKVEVTTLDEMMAKEKFERVDFVKMDVQELELKVLWGAQELIKKFKPHFLIEFNNENLINQSLYIDFQFPLNDHYEWKPVGSKSTKTFPISELRYYAENQLKTNGRHTNYLFIPKN